MHASGYSEVRVWILDTSHVSKSSPSRSEVGAIVRTERLLRRATMALELDSISLIVDRSKACPPVVLSGCFAM